MKNVRLQDWEWQAIYDGYMAGEKLQALACEFRIHESRIRVVVKRMGAKMRRAGRPSKNNRLPCEMRV